MDNKVKALPYTHYPQTYNPHSTKRELFHGWGGVTGLDIKDDSDEEGEPFVAQYCHQAGPWDSLRATTASMPLLKHNPYPGYVPEPCMAHKSRKKVALLKASSQLKRAKGRVINNNDTRKIRKTLRVMQRHANPDLVPTDHPPPDSGSSDEGSGLVDSDSSSSGQSSNDDRHVAVGYHPRPSMLYLSNLCHINLKDFIDRSPNVLQEDCQALEVNSLYTGGCLATIQLNERRGLIVTPRGAKLQNLYMTSYSLEGHSLIVTDPDHTSGSIAVESQIYQIDGKLTQGQVFIGVREERKCQVMVVDPGSADTQVIHSCDWEEQQLLTSMAVSPYIAGEALVSTQKCSQGLVHLLNQSPGSEPSVVAGPFEERFSGPGDWSQCYWGPHPRQLAVADRTGVALWDIRAGTVPSTDLLSFPHKSFHAWERVMTACRHPTQPFYHTLATDYSLILLDSRFPNHPVLKWPHSLLSLPQHIEVIPSVLSMGEDLVLVGSQSAPEVHVYPINMNVASTTPPLATGSPWRVSRMMDFAHLACRTEPTMTENLISSRLDVPLVGIGGVSHGLNKPGFSVLQVSSTGNLFCQDYCQSLSSDTLDKTWCAGPASSKLGLSQLGLSKAHSWLKALVGDKSLNLKLQKLNKIDVSQTLGASTNAQLDPHILCGFCSSIFIQRNETEEERDEQTNNQRCFRCTNTIGYTDVLRAASRQDRVIMSASDVTTLPEKLQSVNLDPAVYDTTTQIVLKLMHGGDVADLVKSRDQQREAEITEKFAKWKEKKLEEQVGNQTPVGTEEGDGAGDVSDAEDTQSEVLAPDTDISQNGRTYVVEPTLSTSEIHHSAPTSPPQSETIAPADMSQKCSESNDRQSGTDSPETMGGLRRSRHFSMPISMPSINRITSPPHLLSPPRTPPYTPQRVRHFSTSSHESVTFNIGFASTPPVLKNKSQKKSKSFSRTLPIVTPHLLEKSAARLMASGDSRLMQPPAKKKPKKYSLGF